MKTAIANLIKLIISTKRQLQPKQEQLSEPVKDNGRLRLVTINLEIQKVIDIAA